MKRVCFAMEEDRVYWKNDESDGYIHLSLSCPKMKNANGVAIGTIKEAVESGHSTMCPDCAGSAKNQFDEKQEKKKGKAGSVVLGIIGGIIGFFVLEISTYVFSALFAILNSIEFYKVVLSWPVGADLIATVSTNMVPVILGFLAAKKIGKRPGVVAYTVICVLLIVLTVFLMIAGYMPVTFNQILGALLFAASVCVVFDR